jgi:hypothetical protein
MNQSANDDLSEKLLERRRETLQWLANEHFNEQRNLQATDEKLFNWALTVFMAGFGALSGLRTMSTGSWSLSWRLVLWLGVGFVMGGILLVASQVRRNFEQNERELTNIVGQLVQMADDPPLARPLWETNRAESRQGFYLRWGAVSVLAVATVVLIGLMGG